MIWNLLASQPEIALFASLAIGFFIGSFKFGPIQLGGVCGTLIVALILGQSGARLSPDLKNIAFALFIFALGFTGGPQFFANIGRGWRYGLLSVVELVVVLGLVLGAVALFELDRGTAAGLLAGAATESAVVGTASEAIGKLALPAAEIARLQANIVTAYSVSYLFGLAAFVAAVGLNSGLAAVVTVKNSGLTIFLLGAVVTILPLVLTMLFGRYVLRYTNAALLAGALTGSRSANPAFGGVLDKAESAVPTVPFAITYALANVLLTLLGPLVVGLV